MITTTIGQIAQRLGPIQGYVDDANTQWDQENLIKAFKEACSQSARLAQLAAIPNINATKHGVIIADVQRGANDLIAGIRGLWNTFKASNGTIEAVLLL